MFKGELEMWKNDPLTCIKGTENLFSLYDVYTENRDTIKVCVAENLTEEHAKYFINAYRKLTREDYQN